MDFEPIAAISLQEINVSWTSDLDGTSIDPTASRWSCSSRSRVQRHPVRARPAGHLV